MYDATFESIYAFDVWHHRVVEKAGILKEDMLRQYISIKLRKGPNNPTH